MYLLDTCVIAELRKKRPDAGVLGWILKQQDEQLYVSVVTLGEIERSIEKQRKPEPDFAAELATWLENLTRLYADRLLPVSPGIARRGGRLAAQVGRDGVDLVIAATAQALGLTLVTRNIEQFEPLGVPLINPFKR